MHCFGTYFTHAQTCDSVRVQSATQCTASVHTLHMPKPVITFVFKVLRNALLRYILYTSWMAAQKMRSRCHCVLLHSYWRLNTRIKRKQDFSSSLAFFRATFSLVFAIDSAMVENMWGWSPKRAPTSTMLYLYV